MEVNKKVSYHPNVFKQYIKRRNDNETPELLNFKDQHLMPCNACTRVYGIEEELSVDDDEPTEFADDHQKETIRNVSSGIG